MRTARDLQQAFRYLFPAELDLLQELARSLPFFPVVINIGAGAGTSGLAFMEARDDLRLTTVDIQEEDSPFGCLFAERKELAAAGYWTDFGGRWTQVHMDSFLYGNDYLIATFPAPEVDLVFIDGDHSYEGCKRDIEAWLPNIRPGGYIAIHDYGKDNIPTGPDGFHACGPHPKAWPGVDQAVNELLTPHLTQTHLVDSLIVFQVGLL